MLWKACVKVTSQEIGVQTERSTSGLPRGARLQHSKTELSPKRTQLAQTVLELSFGAPLRWRFGVLSWQFPTFEWSVYGSWSVLPRDGCCSFAQEADAAREVPDEKSASRSLGGRMMIIMCWVILQKGVLKDAHQATKAYCDK